MKQSWKYFLRWPVAAARASWLTCSIAGAGGGLPEETAGSSAAFGRRDHVLADSQLLPEPGETPPPMPGRRRPSGAGLRGPMRFRDAVLVSVADVEPLVRGRPA
jgi:hypothetical protein